MVTPSTLKFGANGVALQRCPILKPSTDYAYDGVQYYRYADVTQPCVLTTQLVGCQCSMRALLTSDSRVVQRQNDLQLNTDKSEAVIVGTLPRLEQAIPDVCDSCWGLSTEP